MKQLTVIGGFLIFIGQLCAQNTPSNFAVKVSYDVEITTFKQIPATADISRLTNFEKLSFKPIVERQHQDHYLSASNDITTIISYGPTTSASGEEVYQDNLKRLVIDPNGVFGYDANNRALNLGPVGAKAQENEVALKQATTRENFLVTPAFSLPTTDAVAAARNNGYTVTTSGRSYVVSGNGEEFTYDADRNLKERKVFKNGQPFSTTRQFYAQDARGQNIPSVKIETSYETSLGGLLIEVVTIEKITNYSRISN